MKQIMKQIITGGIIGAGLLLTGPATAHNSHGHHSHEFEVITPIIHPAPRPARHCVSGKQVNNLQAQLKRSIKKGIRKGQLVGWEIAQAKKQQRKIRKAEQRMRNSGHCLTRHEANKLKKRLNRAKQKVRNLKRNHIRYSHRGHHHHRGANR